MNNKLITKFISLFLIINLFFIRGLVFVPEIFAQSSPAPTSAPAATSIPAPTSPPSASNPTSAPAPTSAPGSTSAPMPTSPPSPTNPPSSTAEASPTNASDHGTNQEANSPMDSPIPTSEANGQDEINNLSGTGQNTDSYGSSSGSSGESVNDPANVGTGPLSENFASEINSKIQETLNKDLAELQNKIDAISATGFNYANLNTLDGQVFTGNSQTTLNLLNKLNSNIAGIGGFSVFNIYDTYLGDIIFNFNQASNQVSNSFDNASSLVAKNVVTGPGSTNVADASDSFAVKEVSGNDAKIVNDITLESVSGGNSASFNTGDGSIKTGNAQASGNIVNLANTNLNVSEWLFGVVNVFGTLAGNIILPQDTGESNSSGQSAPVLVENSATGPGSTNNVTYNNEDLSSLKNANTASVTSNVDVSANTGNNNASINTGGGSVTSGVADASVNNSTIANVNTVEEDGTVWMVIVNEAGKWVGHILGNPWGSNTASNSLPIESTAGATGDQTYSTLVQNSATGPLSDNDATYTNTSDSSVLNENNAYIENNVEAIADSGNNEASYNTGAGQIETGNAKVGLNLVNMVNTNVTAKKFVAIFVNVLGTFLGDVIPPEEQLAQSSVYNPTPTVSLQPTTSYPQQITPTSSVIEIVADQQSDPYSDDLRVGSTDEQTSYPVFETSYYYDESYTSSILSDQVYQMANQTVSSPVQQKIIRRRNPVSNQVNPQIVSNLTTVNNQALVKRGTFLSPAFAKATETTFPGILLGGARLNVSQSWLSIVPLAILLILIRRRRKIQFTKYLNALLEVVL
jgi:hypothetical protein